MNSIRLPFPPLASRSRGRHCLLTIASGFALAVACGRAAPPTVATFQFEVTNTIFDGVDLPVVVLRAPGFVLRTDSLAGWSPLDTPTPGSGFTMHGPIDRSVTANLFILAPDWANESDATWQKLVATEQARLGDGTVLADKADSSQGPPAIRLFSWRTREISFTPPAPTEAQTITEFWVFATDGKRAFLVELRGSPRGVAASLGSFRMFLARLSLD